VAANFTLFFNIDTDGRSAAYLHSIIVFSEVPDSKKGVYQTMFKGACSVIVCSSCVVGCRHHIERHLASARSASIHQHPCCASLPPLYSTGYVDSAMSPYAFPV
jgi:hypothetical protein